MKINCTKREKEIILKAFHDADLCPFEERFGVICCPGSCDACCEKNIDWDMKDGDGDG